MGHVCIAAAASARNAWVSERTGEHEYRQGNTPFKELQGVSTLLIRYSTYLHQVKRRSTSTLSTQDASYRIMFGPSVWHTNRQVASVLKSRTRSSSTCMTAQLIAYGIFLVDCLGPLIEETYHSFNIPCLDRARLLRQV